jgi:hypothetical protein
LAVLRRVFMITAPAEHPMIDVSPIDAAGIDPVGREGSHKNQANNSHLGVRPPAATAAGTSLPPPSSLHFFPTTVCVHPSAIASDFERDGGRGTKEKKKTGAEGKK